MIKLKKIIKENLDNNIIEKLTFYNVKLSTEDNDEQIYFGTSYDKAKNQYDNFSLFNPKEYINKSDLTLIFEKYTNEYKYIDEIEDKQYFPVEDFYDSENIYELIKKGDYETIEYKKINNPNDYSNEVLSEVENYYSRQYRGNKYHTIYVYPKDTIDESEVDWIGKISLRIAEHTENIYNNGRYNECDYYISVVIANIDVTRERFGVQNAFERTSNEISLNFNPDYNNENTAENIIEKVNMYIEQCIDKIQTY